LLEGGGGPSVLFCGGGGGAGGAGGDASAGSFGVFWLTSDPKRSFAGGALGRVSHDGAA
jgi:hypothetical protein